MNMLNIYICRHGQNEDNANGILNGHRDLPLTDLGIQQAEELADGIKNNSLSFDTVYSSPLKRAKQTAEIISQTTNSPKPQILDDLIERDFGIMSGQRTADIEKLCSPDIMKTSTVTYFLKAEGAETFLDMFKRAQGVLDYLDSKHKSGSILLSTHGDFGKMLYGAFYKIDWREILKKFHFGNCELLVLSKDSSSDNTHIIHMAQHNN